MSGVEICPGQNSSGLGIIPDGSSLFTCYRFERPPAAHCVRSLEPPVTPVDIPESGEAIAAPQARSATR
jgi:hypothetical protein